MAAATVAARFQRASDGGFQPPVRLRVKAAPPPPVKVGAQPDTATKVGRCCPSPLCFDATSRAAQTSTRKSGAMFSCAYPHGSASIAALAGGEIGANRQVCPTIVGGCVKLRP
jgi:hypothetical protein